MPTTPATFPGVSRLICLASEQYPRYSEADVTPLADGRLLLALARKDGPSDFAPGTLVGLRSADAGLTWDDQPHVILPPFADRTDLMSASFCRSPRGLHLFFLARGTHPTRDTLVYQLLSTDDGQTWSAPARVSPRDGYHIVNNARVIRTSRGRILVPAAYVPGDIRKLYNHQRVLCLYSDDDGQTWRESNELSLDAKPLMEPGIAECADGSLYMTIRTSLGHVYEARSADAGATWTDLRSTGLTAPAAPSTVTRAPAGSTDLWLFWCDRPATAKWKGRSRQVVAVSHDHGRTWGAPRPIEDDPKHSYGYISVTPVHPDHILLTYYDWTDRGQRDFLGTDLRQRLIPLDFFRNRPTPPVFQKSSPTPVLTADQPWEGGIVSLNSGLLPAPDKWRAFYTNGTLDPHGESLRVCYAESTDQGLTWTKPPRPNAPTPDTNIVLPSKDDAAASCYHASVHRTGDQTAVAYVWRRAPKHDSALHRYTLSPDFRTLTPDPARPLIASHNASPDVQRLAGPGRISNDAFDLLHNPDGTWDYFAARVQPATDPRTVVKQDNAAGLLRLIARATSPDGLRFSPTDVVLRPDYDAGDPLDTQFYAIQLLRYRGFYLGLLHTFHVRAQTIQPEWAWSHTGDTWSRTHTPCIPLGDEGAFDSRMIVFGSLALTDDHLVWLYTGYDRPHNAFRHSPLRSSVGRATLPLSTLNTWLDTLPQP